MYQYVSYPSFGSPGLVECVDIGSLEPVSGNTECPGAEIGDLGSIRNFDHIWSGWWLIYR